MFVKIVYWFENIFNEIVYGKIIIMKFVNDIEKCNMVNQCKRLLALNNS